MRRWAWNIFCILSLLVFVLSVGIWVRSCFVTAELERFSRQTDLMQQPPLTRTLGYGIGWGTGTLGISLPRRVIGATSVGSNMDLPRVRANAKSQRARGAG